MTNPYPESIRDKVSGCRLTNEKHHIWKAGHDAKSQEDIETLAQWLYRQENYNRKLTDECVAIQELYRAQATSILNPIIPAVPSI